MVDLNGDGRLDYCVTDTGPVRCMLADETGDRYYDAGTAWGMVPAGFTPDWHWSAWSIELIDFDNDGNLDAAMGAGDEVHPRMYWDPWNDNFQNVDPGEVHHQDTLLWGAGDRRYTDAASLIGFDTPPYHYGVVSADFDGDGFREIVLQPPEGRPDYWQNRCGVGSWLEIKLQGADHNRDGIGAVVTVEAGSVSRAYQVQALRGFGQGDSRLHFGLGTAKVADRIVVQWADGEQSEAEEIAVNRLVTIRE